MSGIDIVFCIYYIACTESVMVDSNPVEEAEWAQRADAICRSVRLGFQERETWLPVPEISRFALGLYGLERLLDTGFLRAMMRTEYIASRQLFSVYQPRFLYSPMLLSMESRLDWMTFLIDVEWWRVLLQHRVSFASVFSSIFPYAVTDIVLPSLPYLFDPAILYLGRFVSQYVHLCIPTNFHLLLLHEFVLLPTLNTVDAMLCWVEHRKWTSMHRHALPNCVQYPSFRLLVQWPCKIVL
eukprot:m.25627 g.25627  ORF g.25627 m.25627 type:complete len:240 (-) comp8743_c1_seq1:1272-1991(-)